MDFSKIKLIVWDLDETLWKGILSEEVIELPETHKKLIVDLTDMGIVNSICSKNDLMQVESELEKLELSDFFVFKSVDWSSKGDRVYKIVKDMQLRFQNVLFIDDNKSNLEEVKYFCPGIMASLPDIIPEMIEWANGQPKKDKTHKRINQYKILEKKSEIKSNFASNEEFLLNSHIKLDIKSDCIDNLERIHDLVMRANQLNFTKKRDSLDELKAIISDASFNCGYVSVKDDFGDYGIVGFYAIKDGNCHHFIFSCRILGMGIEQYTYNFLNRPKLDAVGEVVSDLSLCDLPEWINCSDVSERKNINVITDTKEHTVLIKGPCDLYQIFPFISKSNCIDTEFTYVTDKGLVVESTGHTTHIVEANRLSAEQKELIINELPISDIGAYNDNIYRFPYKVVVLSLLTDCNLGVYRRKETGEKLAFLEYTNDMTNPEIYNKLINRKCNVCGFDFTEEFLKKFTEKYEFLGRNTPEMILENLKYIREHLSNECALVLMLGTETYYDMGDNPAYKDRHVVHKHVNDLVRKWARSQDKVELIDVNRYITGPESYYDHINHFIKPIYYNMAKDIVEVINKYTGENISETSKVKILYMRLHDFVGNILAKIRHRW